MTFHIDQDMLQTLLEWEFGRSQYMTSAEVVMEASGLRLEAVRSIAREHGIEINDVRSRCIDENLLSYLADAHIRRLKAYFNKSKRHLSELSCEDYIAFDDFCQTFKKSTFNYKPVSWNDIDVDAIREQFYEKVYSLCPKTQVSNKQFGECILKGLDSVVIERTEPDPIFPYSQPFFYTYDRRFLSEWLEHSQEKFFTQNAVLDKVYESICFYAEPIEIPTVNNNNRVLFRRVSLSARYYVFPDEDYHIVC